MEEYSQLGRKGSQIDPESNIYQEAWPGSRMLPLVSCLLSEPSSHAQALKSDDWQKVTWIVPGGPRNKICIRMINLHFSIEPHMWSWRSYRTSNSTCETKWREGEKKIWCIKWGEKTQGLQARRDRAKSWDFPWWPVMITVIPTHNKILLAPKAIWPGPELWVLSLLAYDPLNLLNREKEWSLYCIGKLKSKIKNRKKNS